MNSKNCIIISKLDSGFIVLMDFFSAPVPQCQTTDRVECGYFGINEAECEYRGCCWSPTTASGQPWCYYEKGNVLLKSHNTSTTTGTGCLFLVVYFVLLSLCNVNSSEHNWLSSKNKLISEHTFHQSAINYYIFTATQ